MASGDGAECYQQLVVNRLGIVKERADNFLNAAFAVIVKALRSISFGSELGFGTIGNWNALVWGETGLA